MAPSISVILSSFHPFPTISFSLPPSTPLSSLPHILSPLLHPDQQSLSTSSGTSISLTTSGHLFSLNSTPHASFVHLRLVPKVLGGKGGFGSQLRAAGGRMSSQKTQNNDSCRDLTGRRLSTIKEAKKLAAAIASEPERQAAQRREAEAKLIALNEEIARLDALVNGTDEGNVRKRRLNDSKELEQSKEGIEKVKSAVAMAMLKKKKKAKLAGTATSKVIEETKMNVIEEEREDVPITSGSISGQEVITKQATVESLTTPVPDAQPAVDTSSETLAAAIDNTKAEHVEVTEDVTELVSTNDTTKTNSVPTEPVDANPTPAKPNEPTPKSKKSRKASAVSTRKSTRQAS
ncbi:hypothetical protein CROQUDRAFT_672863 [Cronartium quercuum f. sp. fusiforme G11]|uniref:SDE2-like domain-containing protein n=1 Tax=Cronartium quercuum f. sp. fusiforme G11 TaxID=708437 RepID=A0A9P6NGB1_9BASI|nr:hypothetical protein CROQUDRAFT_672863 [Cronartium quercuum f. sp. fusiforme G11]